MTVWRKGMLAVCVRGVDGLDAVLGMLDGARDVRRVCSRCGLSEQVCECPTLSHGAEAFSLPLPGAHSSHADAPTVRVAAPIPASGGDPRKDGVDQCSDLDSIHGARL